MLHTYRMWPWCQSPEPQASLRVTLDMGQHRGGGGDQGQEGSGGNGSWGNSPWPLDQPVS